MSTQSVSVGAHSEGLSGGDGSLTHVPVVPCVTSQAPDLPVLGLPAPHVDVERPDAVAVHVGPEPQAQRPSASWAGGRELLAL